MKISIKPTMQLQTENHIKQESKGCSGYPETGLCLARAGLESLALTGEGEELMVGVGRGMVEYLVTGDIRETWGQLRRYHHVNTVVSCLNHHGRCDA